MKPIDLIAVHEHLSYDPDTGIFRWRVSKRGHRKKGDIAGSVTRHGYLRIKINQVAYLAHRIAWAFVTGADPVREIDHRNGNGHDNRFANLREASRWENCQNVKGQGVRFEPERSKWLARICVGYKQINLGRFDTRAAARAAYLNASREHRGEFSRGV